MRDDTSSATGGLYVYIRNGVNFSTFVEWQVDVPTTGEYLVSLRYALDYSPRPMSVSLVSMQPNSLDDILYNSYPISPLIFRSL